MDAVFLALACAFALFAAAPGSAQSTTETVRVDGRAVFQVGPGDEGADASVRADRIEQRLETLLSNVDSLGPATARQSGRDWVITVSGVPVASVTPRDAEDNLTTQRAVADQWARALHLALRRARDRRAGWAGRFGAETRASAEAAFGRLGESAVRVVPRAIAAVAVILLFWLVARTIRFLLSLVFRKVIEDVTVESLIKQLTYYAILALGFFVALDALGFNPTTVAAGIGLTGVVLGFALRDVLSNFVSGLLLLMLRPFEIGDQIVIGDLEGSVERIELRATRLRAYDGRVLLVPNAEVFTSRIINNTADPIRRGKVQAWIGYDVDLKRAAEAARDAVRGAPGVLEVPEPVVRVDELDRDDIILEITFWTDSRRADYKNTASFVRAAIIAGFKAAGIDLPNPDVRLLAPTNADAWRSVVRDAGEGRSA
ncbi:MAG: mechanosensitive ion channel family protein [Pseudomonadota bacterium]|nr:mechanosensitive ion channel family protein [Pseudomonadota bacterium]